MYVIEIIRDLRDIPAGTCLLAVPHDRGRFRTLSSIRHLNGRIIHLSFLRVICYFRTPEDLIIEGIKTIYKRWSDEPATSDYEQELTVLARRIYHFVKEELERQNAGSG